MADAHGIWNAVPYQTRVDVEILSAERLKARGLEASGVEAQAIPDVPKLGEILERQGEEFDVPHPVSGEMHHISLAQYRGHDPDTPILITFHTEPRLPMTDEEAERWLDYNAARVPEFDHSKRGQLKEWLTRG
jgi:hypothetical protein